MSGPGLVPLGEQDAGLCVDGVCRIPGSVQGVEPVEKTKDVVCDN